MADDLSWRLALDNCGRQHSRWFRSQHELAPMPQTVCAISAWFALMN
jgi:hypothetical protein